MNTVRRQSEYGRPVQCSQTRGRCQSEVKEPPLQLTQAITNCIQRSQHSIDRITEIRAKSKERRSSQKKPTHLHTNGSIKSQIVQTSPSFRYENQSLVTSIQDSFFQKPVRLFSFTEDETSFRARDMPLQVSMNRESKETLQTKQKPIIRQKENRRYVNKNNLELLFQEALVKSRQITMKYK